jgi:phosphoglycolate phosphatase
MRKYKYLIFDLDGTIIDPKVGGFGGIKYALDKYGLKDYDENLFRHFIGPPLHLSFAKYYGFDSMTSAKLCDYFREYYDERGKKECTLYDGMAETLKTLHREGFIMAIATTKPIFFAKQILDMFGISKYFFHISGSGLDNSKTEKGELIQEALTAFGRPDKDSVVMIGDREFDLIGALEHRIDSIAVEYGYGDYEEFVKYNATFIVKSVEELQKLLLK